MLCPYVFLLPVWIPVYPFCCHVLWLQMWPFAAPFSTLWLWPVYTVFVLSSSPGWVAFSLSSHPSPLRHDCHTAALMWLITFSVTVTPLPLGLCWLSISLSCCWISSLPCPAPPATFLLQWSPMFVISPYWRYNQARGHNKDFAISASYFTVVSMGYGVCIFVYLPLTKGHPAPQQGVLSSSVSSHDSWIRLFSVYEMKPWKKLLKNSLVKCQNSVKGIQVQVTGSLSMISNLSVFGTKWVHENAEFMNLLSFLYYLHS